VAQASASAASKAGRRIIVPVVLELLIFDGHSVDISGSDAEIMRAGRYGWIETVEVRPEAAGSKPNLPRDERIRSIFPESTGSIG
jgi:hypothetical protein